MKNPYSAPPPISLEVDGIVRTRPVVACIVTTTILVPICFVGLIYAIRFFRPMNNAGVLVYGVACLVAAPIVALINAFVIAPLLAFRMKASSSYFKAIGINTTALMMAIVAIVVWRIAFLGWTKFSTWTIMPWYLSIFLTPPVIAGSLVYSCVWIRTWRVIAVNGTSIAEQSDARETSAQSVLKSKSTPRCP